MLVNRPEGPRFLGLSPGPEGESSDGLPRELDGDLLRDLDGDLSGEVALGLSGDRVLDLAGDIGIDRTGDRAGDLAGALLGILGGGLTGDLAGDSLGALAGDRMGVLTGDLARDRRGLVGGISRGTWSGFARGSPRTLSPTGGMTGAPACLPHMHLRACSSAAFLRCLNSTSVRILPSCSATASLSLSVNCFCRVASCCLWSSLVFSSNFEKAPFLDFSSLIVSLSWRASPSIWCLFGPSWISG
jgi:hypothetical protein